MRQQTIPNGNEIFYIGQICLFPYDFTPKYFLKCEGQTLQTDNYKDLYSLLGNKYGGDETFFLLPDLTNIAPKGCSYYICIDGLYPTRSEQCTDDTQF